MTVVLDSSAVLAWLLDEPGAGVVDELLSDALMSSLNWSEVLQKSLMRNTDVTNLRTDMEVVGLTIVPFDVDDAEKTAHLWTVGKNLSLADRACLTLAIENELPVWTADSQWMRHATGADVHLIRKRSDE